jgi:hypothetical protein
MRLNHAAASGLALALLLLCLSSIPLYGAEPLELKKEWQQPGTKTERQGKTPQVPPGELQLKEHWRGSGNVPKSNTDELKLKSDWQKPASGYHKAPTTNSGELKLKSDWKRTDAGVPRQDSTPNPQRGLQLKGECKNSK